MSAPPGTIQKPPAPPRVRNLEKWWAEPPPSPSARCLWWLDKINAGWRPGRRIRQLGYYTSAEWYGVYIWEYLHVLSPVLSAIWIAEAGE